MEQTTQHPTDAELIALAEAAERAAAHPGVAAPLRELLPALVGALVLQTQQLRELQRPCPCEAAEAGAALPLVLGGDGFPIPAGA
jgi:hypothetical protein